MSYTDGLVLAPIVNNPPTGDIQKALGLDTGNLGILCTAGQINIFSRYKPNALTWANPTDEQIETARYNLWGQATSNRASLASMAMGWTYNAALPPRYRQLDFHRYYNGAVCPFMQANGQSLLIDLVSGNAAPAAFYLLMRSGALANKPFVQGSGIGSSGTAVPSTRLDYCMTVEDLGFSDNGTFHSLMGAYLGLVIFSGTTYRGEVWASTAVAQLPVRDNNMFIVPTDDINIAPGTYTAVACARKSESGLTYYLPVYNDASYPARFTLVVGGVDYYKQQAVGLATTATGSTVTRLTTIDSNIYVRMRLYNNTGSSVTLNVRDGRFVLSTRITGTVTDYIGTSEIDRTQTSELVYPTSDITVADGGYGDMVFQLRNIWSNTAGSNPRQIESGEVTVAPTLQFYRGGTMTDFPLYGPARLLRVIYG